MARLFGTDGVRGVVNEFLTPELAYHLGRAAGTHFGKKKDHPTFLIGRDTRISGSMLESALAAGICSVGGNVVIAGVIPTPAVAYLVRQQGFDAEQTLRCACGNSLEQSNAAQYSRKSVLGIFL